MMWKNILIYVTILITMLLATANGNALGPCSSGRGVPVVATGSGGACGLPTDAFVGFPTVNLNQAFFASGTKCGACYEVTGPLGTVTVMVTDQCGSSSPKCGGDKDNFGIEKSAYALIANATTTDIIYDLGYRLVTCDITGNVKAVVGSGINNYYFSLVVYNSRYAIDAVGVKCSNMPAFESLSRQNSVWTWNKNNYAFALPLTLSVVAGNGEVLQYKFSTFTSGQVLDLGFQFTDVPAGNGLCPLGIPPAAIFTSDLTYGWSTTYSFAYKNPVSVDNSTTYNGNPSLFADLYGYGGLQFTRNGGFDSGYFTSLSFAVRSNNGAASLKVYVGSPTDRTIVPVTFQNQITTEWKTFNISIADLQPRAVETDLVFQNADSNDAQFWFSNVQFSLAPATDNPLTNVTYTTSTTGTGSSTTSSATTTGSSGTVITPNTGIVGNTGVASTTSYNFDTSSSTGASTTSTSDAASVMCSIALIFVSLAALL